MIISASRRTDIPSFYSDWLINRLNEGYVLVPHPRNLNQLSKISLKKEDVDCIVFWTKDAKPLFDKIEKLDGYKFYFQHTITSYQKDLEPNMRRKSDILDTFIEMSKVLGANRMVWRYDPILLNDKYTEEYHYEYFEKFCQRLQGHTSKCIISFLDLYGNVNENINGLGIYTPNKETRIRMASTLSEIALKYGIQLESCSEDMDLTPYGVRKSSCIDKNLIEEVIGYELDVKKDSGQRENCGCVKSAEVGQYNTCIHGCKYCYATNSKNIAIKNSKKHNKNSPIIIGDLSGHEKISEHKIKKIKANESFQQLNLLDLMNRADK